MFDIMPEIYKKLKEIPNVHVSRHWIGDKKDLPNIIFYEVENIPYDPTRTLYKVVYTIHVFDEVGSLKRIPHAVEVKLWELGLTCTSNREVLDDRDRHIVHRRLSFEGIINIKTNLVFTN